MAARQAFGLAALACATLVVFGSWAPLRFHHADFPDVWKLYLDEGKVLSQSRTDLVANILLGIPFAYALMGFLASDGKGRGRTLANVLLVMSASALLAVLVELGQGWFPGRVPSIRDSIAQIFGASIGCVTWWLTGDRMLGLLNRLLTGAKPISRAQAAISLIAMGVLVWSVMPFDVLVSPVDIAKKWKNDGIELIPFTRSHASVGESVYQWIASVFLAMPLGLWASQFLRLSVQRSTSLTVKVLIAVGLGVLPEALQISIAGRVASATDAIFGVIGAGLGIAIGELLSKSIKGSSKPKLYPPIRQPTFWFLVMLVYFGIVCILSWYPFNFETNPRRIHEILHELAANPVSDYQGSNLTALFVFARLAVITSILGILAGIGTGMIRQPAARVFVACAMFFLAFVCSVLLELGQLLESTHSGDGLGLMIRLIAIWCGLALGVMVCRGGGLFSDTDDRQTQSKSPNIFDNRVRVDSDVRAKHDVYVAGMDGLRAVACLAVFGVHWQQMTNVGERWGAFDFAQLLDNGNTGVAIFMILSGFLLALPIFATPLQARSRFSLRDFGRRRVAKILPTYYLCLFGLVIVKAHLQSPRQFGDVLLHLTFLHNLTPSTLYSISPPFWALAPVIQFYVLFAVVIAVLQSVGSLSDRTILATFAAICVVSQLLVTAFTFAAPWGGSSEYWVGRDAVGLQHSLASHVCIFGLGIFAAWAHHHLPHAVTKKADTLVLICTAATLLILATSLDAKLRLPGGRYNFPVVPLLLTSIVLAAPRGAFSRWLLERTAIRRLGVISYAFYLFHLPTMQLLKLLGQKLGFTTTDHAYLFTVLAFGLTVITSELVYRLLERPVATLLRRRPAAQ